jgi:predicted MFS family arabinose efflux permease
MHRILIVIGFIAFATSLSFRAIDPGIPLIAADLGVSAERAALLSTAFAFPFALGQPVLGPIADIIGKTRVMTMCVAVFLMASVTGFFAPNFPVLAASRVIAGISAGGIFPIALATAGDMVPLARRQVVIGRLLACTLSGAVFGATAGGIVGDLFGWRGVFMLLSVCGVVALASALIGFRGGTATAGRPFNLGTVIAGYRRIFANPLAIVCFGAVFVEGACIFGLLPYVAVLLHSIGEDSATVAGIVIAGFPIGGVALSLTLPLLLRVFGQRGLMRLGGSLVGAALLAFGLSPFWIADFGAFLLIGFGFYMIHTGIQTFTTELAPTARASGVALHAFFFFLGQGSGPIAYGAGLTSIGPLPSLAVAAAAMVILGLYCAHRLRRPDAA